MATQSRIGGTIFLYVDGARYAARGNFKVNPTLFSREGVAGQDGVHGFKETPTVPSIEGEITDLGNLSVKSVIATEEGTVTVSLGNGKTWILMQAWFAGETSVDTVEGKLPVKWEGRDIREVTA